MYIEPSWRILTIGDGDLSFSLSLARHYRLRELVATVLDSEDKLIEKYKSDNLARLNALGTQVMTEFDVTNPETWHELKQKQFDLVIFQFPLIPALGSTAAFQQSYGVNTLNRALLRHFLKHSFEHFLDPTGAALAYISSKDVKPYIEWDMERSLHRGLDIRYLGKHEFQLDAFSGYRIRNVDRDKHVKDTLAFTHVWGRTEWSNPQLPLMKANEQIGDCCIICRAGPFETEQERRGHLSGKRHRRLAEFDKQWQYYLRQEK